MTLRTSPITTKPPQGPVSTRCPPSLCLAIVASVAALILACGGGVKHTPSPPQPTYVLHHRWLRRGSVDPKWDQLASNLGDKCESSISVGARFSTSRFELRNSILAGAVGGREIPDDPSFVLASYSQSAPQGTRRAKIHDLENLAFLEDIEVAQYRAAKSELLIIGPSARGASGIRPDDFLTAFRAVSAGTAPGVSIDPTGDVRIMKVRYFGGVERSRLGAALFEADRLLKLMSTGFDNLDCSRWSQMPFGLRSELDLLSTDFQARGREALGQTSWHRFWFEYNDNPVGREDSKTAIEIPVDRLAVNEQSVPAGSPSPPSARQFAAALTGRFLQLSESIESFRDVRRAAGLTSLAKWFVDRQVAVDREWLATIPTAVPTPESTPRVTVTRSSLDGDYIRQIGIEGGVDFQKPNIYVSRPGHIDGVLNASAACLSSGVITCEFTFQDRTYRAVRLRYQNPAKLHPRAVSWDETTPDGAPGLHYSEMKAPASRLSVTNNTSASLRIIVSGSASAEASVPPSSTRDISVQPGTYSVGVTASCGTVSDSLTIGRGEVYSATYYCSLVQAPYVPPPTPQPSLGTLTVVNQTGTAITLQINGPTAGTYTAPAGTSSFQLAPGQYTITASSTCGGRTDSFSLSSRSKSIQTYSCVTVRQ